MFFGKFKEASNPYTNFVTLRKLATSKSVKIRAAVAANPNTQSYVIEELAVDGNVNVRLGVARNKNITLKAWNVLIEDDSVKSVLLEVHPDAPAVKSARS